MYFTADVYYRLWDGLLSSTDRIVVLGATNRPNDIDSAILRRMPKRFSVGLPNFEQRLRILNLVSVLPPGVPLIRPHKYFVYVSTHSHP